MDSFFEQVTHAAREQVKRKRDLYEADTHMSDEDASAFHAMFLHFEDPACHVQQQLKRLRELPRDEEYEKRGYMNRVMNSMYKQVLQDTRQELREAKMREQFLQQQLATLQPIAEILKDNERLKETLTDVARHGEQKQRELERELKQVRAENDHRVSILAGRIVREQKEASERMLLKMDASFAQFQGALVKLREALPESPAVKEFMDVGLEIMEDVRLVGEVSAKL